MCACREQEARKQIDESLTYFSLGGGRRAGAGELQEEKLYCCDNHQHATVKQQDLLRQHEGHRITTSLRFATVFQRGLGDTLTSLEQSLDEILKVLAQLGYSSVSGERLFAYLQQEALATEEEVQQLELYQSRGFHSNALPQHQSMQSVYSTVPTAIFSKERVVESTVSYLFEHHYHELLRRK